MIRKKVAQVTGNSEGVTFTKPEKEILGDLKLGDIIEIKKVEKDEWVWKIDDKKSDDNYVWNG